MIISYNVKIVMNSLNTITYPLTEATPADAFREGVRRFKQLGFTRKDIAYVEVVKVTTGEVVLDVVA